MGTYNVYFRVKGKVTNAFVDAASVGMAIRRLRRRYPGAAVVNVVGC